MGVNKPSITTTSMAAAGVSIKFVETRPSLNEVISPADIPGRLVAYYNSAGQSIELYITSFDGTFWMPVGN